MAKVIPIKAAHVNQAYNEARVDSVAFRRNEMGWMSDNHPLLNYGILSRNAAITQRFGPEYGTPYLLGSSLGNRAVRLCAIDPRAYEIARINYRLNMDAAKRMPTEGPWDTATDLDRVFDDHELTEAMLQIGYPITRAAAATMIGFLCLDELPAVPTLHLTIGKM